MRIIRLPGIHHDANAVIFAGSESNVLVDSGTTWYQMLQVERINGHLKHKGSESQLDRILLTSRRYPFSGAANTFPNPSETYQFTFTVMQSQF